MASIGARLAPKVEVTPSYYQFDESPGIADTLARKGLDISRRTVTQYRIAVNIPSRSASGGGSRIEAREDIAQRHKGWQRVIAIAVAKMLQRFRRIPDAIWQVSASDRNHHGCS